MKLLLVFTAFLFTPLLPLAAEEAKPTPSSHKSVRSSSGLIAHYFKLQTGDVEPEGLILIEKEGRVIATIKGARPVSFSPVNDILLVVEDVADDDLRHYFLNIGAGQYSRNDEREERVFGPRFVSKATWSDDGKYLVLFHVPGIVDAPPASVTVSEHLGK